MKTIALFKEDCIEFDWYKILKDSGVELPNYYNQLFYECGEDYQLIKF